MAIGGGSSASSSGPGVVTTNNAGAKEAKLNFIQPRKEKRFKIYFKYEGEFFLYLDLVSVLL